MTETNDSEVREEVSSGGRSRRTKPFPSFPLKEALVIANAIADDNACRPFSRLSIAEVVGRSPESSAFRQLITSSSSYGLTEGSYKALQLRLTDLGLSIVAPKTQEEHKTGLMNAVMNVPLYKKLLEHFDQHKVPQPAHFKNTLIRDFGVEAEDADRCIERFLSDGRFVGLIRDVAGADRVSIHDALEHPSGEYEDLGQQADADEEPDQAELGEPVQPDTLGPELVMPASSPNKESVPLRVFVSHGKNTAIVDQIKTMLDLADLDYVIAVETETTAIPVPDKVLAAMHEAKAAVICVTADEDAKKEDGTYSVNENVLIEIGAAFVLYEKRVVLLWDRRIPVPSNLQGLYRCEFEGDELSWTAGMKLMRTISQFKKGSGPTQH